MSTLSARQERYVSYVLSGLSEKDAALKAGYGKAYAEKAKVVVSGIPVVKAALEAGYKTAKLLELKAKLYGLLIDQIHLKAEVIDLAGALQEAKTRILDNTPTTYLPLPTVDAAHTTPAPVPDVFGD